MLFCVSLIGMHVILRQSDWSAKFILRQSDWSAKFILRQSDWSAKFILRQYRLIMTFFWEFALCIPAWHKCTLFNREML